MTARNASYNYAGVFEGRLDPGQRPAVIIVDMVAAYLEADSPLYCETAQAAVKAAATLLDAARARAVPVFFSNVSYVPGGANGGLFYKKTPVLKVFDEGSPLGAFPPELKPLADEHVITKQYPSAFFATPLVERLAQLKVDTLLITGFSTSGCVRATVLDALQHGFAPFVVRDACADRHQGPHDASLFDIQAKYGEVVSLSRALEILGN